MSTSINNAFIKRSMYMPKGIGYGASSMGKVKKAGIVVVPRNKTSSKLEESIISAVKKKEKREKEERKKKSDGHKSKKSETSRGGAKRTIKNFKKRTRQGV